MSYVGKAHGARSNLAPVLMPFVRGELGDFHLSLPQKIYVFCFNRSLCRTKILLKDGVLIKVSKGSLAKNMVIF